VVVAAVVALRLSDFTRRAKVTAAGAVVAVLLLGAGATAVASSVSPQLRARARGMLNPLGDSNMRARFKLWRQTLHEVEKHPLGSGVGTVGRASGLSNRATVTTDNSYVKILREQGVPGTFFFLAGVLLLCIATFRRLYRAPPFARPLGVAALTAFVSFL